MRVARAVAPVALAALVAACGGGGGDASDPAPQETEKLSDTDAVILSVAFYDMAAAPERLMLLANAHDQLGGLPGAAVRTACSSGSVDTRKVDATTFTLVANDCRLSASDNLVYSGTWKFSVTYSEYNPGGTCTPGATCYLQANVDTSAALFGYGTATEKVVDMQWQQEKSAGVQVTRPYMTNVVDIPEVGKIIFNGDTKTFAVAVYSPPSLIARISATSRSTILVDELIKATLTLDASGVTAAIDTDKNGTVDKTITVPWSAFAE